MERTPLFDGLVLGITVKTARSQELRVLSSSIFGFLVDVYADPELISLGRILGWGARAVCVVLALGTSIACFLSIRVSAGGRASAVCCFCLILRWWNDGRPIGEGTVPHGRTSAVKGARGGCLGEFQLLSFAIWAGCKLALL